VMDKKILIIFRPVLTSRIHVVLILYLRAEGKPLSSNEAMMIYRLINYRGINYEHSN